MSHNVGGVEITDAEGSGHVCGGIVDEVVDPTFDIVLDRREEAVIAVGCVEEFGVAETRCVEL